MNSIDIYTTTTDLNTFIESSYTTDQLYQYYTNATVFGNKAKIIQCCICAKIQDTIQKQHNGNIKSRKYSADTDQILSVLSIKRKQFNKDAAVGRYVIQQNDITLFDLPKSNIESRFLPPKAPTKILKQSKSNPIKSIDSNEAEFYKDILRQFRDWSDTNTRKQFNGICAELDIMPESLGL